MINKNHAEDIRVCERIKFDQALYILTMYEKKIRKNRKNIVGSIDADTEMQDIICSWKNKWKMDLTKPILNCVTSVYPRVIISLGANHHPQLQKFYGLMGKFIERLRVEHEDETNFKLVAQDFQRNEESLGHKYIASSQATVKGFLMMAHGLADQMLHKLNENSDLIAEEMYSEVNTDNVEWQVWRPLRWIREVALRAMRGQGQEMQGQQDGIEPKSAKSEELVSFCANVVRVMERIKESQHGSTLITIQPRIDELTMLVHPLLLAISANFKKENLQKVKDYDWRGIQVDSIPMLQNIKSSYNCSKVAFINFDGYQSEFNLQFARNFKKHLLYISFPKQDAKLDENKRIYSRRFFKKLMFKYTQATYQSFSEQNMSEDFKKLTKMEKLNFNPEDYHVNIQKLYERKNDKSVEDFNQNLYVFPIRLSILREKFSQIMESKDDIQSHQSHFIRFIIKDFLLNQIREFNPTLIMISCSGRIQIEDSHFVELMQEFTKIANYKIVFFPNLTSAFCKEEMMQLDDFEGEQCDYDNFVNDKRINLDFNDEEKMREQGSKPDRFQNWIELFNKIARFLKVSSGTYNLTRNFEEEPLVSKYKNQFILTYADELMTTLGKEYPSIDKIRFRNKDLSILPKLFQQNIRNIKKTFQHTVPRLYFVIYELIQYILFQRNLKPNQKKELQMKRYRVDLSLYEEELQILHDELLSKSDYQITSISFIGNMSQLIEDQKTKKMKQMFQGLKESHLFEISSQKFQEKVNIFIKTQQENKEYAAIHEQTQSLKGLFEVMFYLNHGKSLLKIYESTKILYKIDQITRNSNKIPILVMNNLTDNDSGSEKSFQNYYCQLDITSVQGGEKKRIEEKKCIANPLIFRDDNGDMEKQMSTSILSQWSYHQTQDYLILYWPSRYDFFKCFLLKLMNKPYEPEILNQIYLCDKRIKNNIFQKQNIYSITDLSPRMGCSCYEDLGKIYIFGGFYQRQKNYLELQHDIVVFDLIEYQNAGRTKLVLENIKNNLYSRTAFERRLERKDKSNSFVRPRIQFQFFQKSELFGQQKQIIEDHIKQVIMFGGYGQNFLRPYSLLTYYYYLLKFNHSRRQLESIQKKIIYSKAVPINTKQMTKNLGIIRANRKTKNGVLESNKLTDPDSFTLFRNSFKIENNNGQEQFMYKFKYMFCEDEYKNYKHQIKKIQELRTQDFDSTSISAEKMPGNNHIIILEKDGKRCCVTLRLEIPLDKAKKIDCSRQVNLTHQSIIYLDIWNSVICAIVKHELYTQGKSVLVEYNIKTLQNLNFAQDQLGYLAMAWIKQFDYDLTLHILIICNKNTIAILHGQKVGESEKVKEFIVKRKKNKNQIVGYQIKERQPILRKNEFTSLINTVFFRNRNKIIAIDFISIGDSNNLCISCQQIQLNTSNDQYKWVQCLVDKFDPNIRFQFCLSEKMFLSMGKLKFLDFLKNANQNYLEVEYNRKKYICEMSRHGEILELVEQTEYKLEKQNMEPGIILIKSEDQYNDHDFY